MSDETKQEIAIIERESFDAVERKIEDRARFVDRIHTMLQKRINPKRDIARLGGKARRTINFARICRRVIGGDVAYLRDDKTGLPYRRLDYKDDGGEYYVYTSSCVWSLPWGERVEGVSLVSSRDPFFGIEDEQLKPLSEVNEAHIAQKAVTEAFKQAVFVGLGFPKDVSDDELASYCIDASAASGHSFDSARGKRGGSKDSSQESKDYRALIEVGCKELVGMGYKDSNGNPIMKPEEVLQHITANPEKGWEGWRSFRAIKESQLERINAQVHKEIETFGANDELPY